MKFELIGNLSKIEILILLKYLLATKSKETINNIISFIKYENNLSIEYNSKMYEILNNRIIRDYKIEILQNHLNIEEDIKTTTELIKKKLFNY